MATDPPPPPDPPSIPGCSLPPLPHAGETLRIGRDGANHIVLNGHTVSRFHAEIVQHGDKYVLKDWDSRNGTYVNGKRIESTVELKPHDVIRIGSWQMRFEGTALERMGENWVFEKIKPAVGANLPGTHFNLFGWGSGDSSTEDTGGGEKFQDAEPSEPPARLEPSESPVPAKRPPLGLPPLPRDSEPYRIGSDPANRLVLDGSGVASFHAEIDFLDHRFVIKDWNTKEGTWVNGKRVQSARLHAGDRISLGSFHFFFDGESLRVAPPPAPDSAVASTAQPISHETAKARLLALTALVMVVAILTAGYVVFHAATQASATAKPVALRVQGKVIMPPPAQYRYVGLTFRFAGIPHAVLRDGSEVVWSEDGSFTTIVPIPTRHVWPRSVVVTATAPQHDAQATPPMPLSADRPQLRLETLALNRVAISPPQTDRRLSRPEPPLRTPPLSSLQPH